MGTMLRNKWTTIIGILLGVSTYLSTSGATMPTTKQDWIALGVGILMAALGVAAKDAVVGSKPSP